VGGNFVVQAEFLTLSKAVFMSVTVGHTQSRQHLYLKTWPRLCHGYLSLSLFGLIKRQVDKNLISPFLARPKEYDTPRRMEIGLSCWLCKLC
jgi:hypothetical protein